MEGSRVRALVMVVVVMGMAVAGGSSFTSPSSFKDCYAKCFLFCMIEPNQTLCSCTTQCLKDCIFPAVSPTAVAIPEAAAAQSLGFCKLGCASSLCSNISTKLNPNGQNMESCVGSCSKRCTISYSSSSP